MAGGDDITRSVEGVEAAETLAPEIAGVRAETSKRVAKTLKKASKGNTEVDIDGVDIKDPAQAFETLKQTLAIVKRLVPFDENDLYFRKFAGETAGEALSGGRIEVDPIMLMHPVNRLAHVLLHEYSHKGGDIENEAVVEAYTREMLKVAGLAENDGDGLQLTAKYDEALENFHEFARKVANGAEIPATVRKIYGLYYDGKYETIYEMYEEYMKTLNNDEEKDKAFELFESVFPELEVQANGWYNPYDIEIPKAPNEEGADEGSTVVEEAAASVDSAVEGVKGEK